MGHTLGVAEISHEELAAPEFSIQAKSEAVKRNSDQLAVDLVVSHAARDMRVMMLHRELGRQVREREREPGREILGMQIVSDHFRLDVEQVLVVFDSFGERLQRLEILEISDVMTHKRAVLARETKRVLQLRATCEHAALEFQRGANRWRRITTRTPQHHLAAVETAHD